MKAEHAVVSHALARGYLSSDEPLLHFGLGESDRIDALRIRWPSGIRHELRDVEAGRLYTISEHGEKGADAEPAPRPMFVETTGETG